MNLALEDNYWIKAPTSRVNVFDNGNLFSVSRLDNDGPVLSIGSGNDFRNAYNTYLKAGFVEVIDIAIENALVLDSLLHAPQPCQNLLRIFA